MTAHDGNDCNRADWGADPELLSLLRDADPARSLPPLSDPGLARLSAAAMAAPAAPSRRTVRVLLPAAAAAVVVLVAGVGLGVAARGGDDASTPVAGAPAATATAPTRLRLSPPPGDLRCSVPNAGLLSQQQLAFEGVVSSVGAGAAVLDVTRVFTGAPGSQVQVAEPAAEVSDLLLAVDFQPGGDYLVSATDGQVTLCGYTATATPELRALYEQAFAG